VYDGAKKVNGRKRHLLVDTLGLLLGVRVTAGDVDDRDGAAMLLQEARTIFPRLRYGWVVAGYRGPFLAWAHEVAGVALQVVRRRDGGMGRRWLPPNAEALVLPGFAVAPRRWVVALLVCVAGPLSPTQQGLRVPHRHVRGGHPARMIQLVAAASADDDAFQTPPTK
jgi:transposase